MIEEEPRVLAWFSCGAASAVAAWLAILKYGKERVHVVTCDTRAGEHEDNERFYLDVEKWLGVKIENLTNPKYRTVEEVFAKERYMSGIGGARCTTELKKKPRLAYQLPDDIHIFGYTSDEPKRLRDFRFNNLELTLDNVLADQGITKAATLAIITEIARIALPASYGQGFDHANCKGCVKSESPAYWNRTRKYFPEVFAHRAAQSRELGAKLVRVKRVRMFLDELPPDEMEELDEDLSCGVACAPPSIEKDYSHLLD